MPLQKMLIAHLIRRDCSCNSRFTSAARKSPESSDTYFDRVQDNGDNWIKIVVTFSSVARWSNLRPGTLSFVRIHAKD